MPPQVALLLAAAFVFYAFRSDRREGRESTGLFWPSLWYMVVSSRPLGAWFSLWGFSIAAESVDATEGSSIDRYFFGVLTVLGWRILAKRGFSWSDALRRNPWLMGLIVFMALSILWSDYPFVSFKRYVKVVGSITMAFVIITHERPLEAMCAVLRRCLYVHLPMSLICTRYFRQIGVSFDWWGSTTYWNGISTSKNTLGQVAMLGVVYFAWELQRNWAKNGWRNRHTIFLLMALYLLKGSETSVSMTSVSVCVFALLVFFGIQRLRTRPAAVPSFVTAIFNATLALVVLIQVHSIVLFSADSPFGWIITTFGRDITLTDRTFIWSDVYAATGNPVLGVGFGGFWIGRLANIPWNAKMTWVLGQAHSGYVDTYLQLGLIGDILLAGVIISSLPPMLAALRENFDFGCFRITVFLTIIFINITESVYLRGDHHLWMLLMTVLWNVPSRNRRIFETSSETESHSHQSTSDVPQYA